MDETWWRTPEQLDRDQQDIVSLPLDGSHLVVGPPGSGKTNLLLLRATFLTRAGVPNIAIITFNRLLREFLAAGAENYPFEAARIKTFRSWAMDLLKASGDEVIPDKNFEVLRRRLISGLTDLAARKDDALKFECILVDEAQDYTLEEIKLIRQFSHEIFAVGDDNQRIYRADGSLRYLEGICNFAPPLRYHYRNGTAICRFADGIMGMHDGGMLATCNYDELRYPSSVQRHGGLKLIDQVKLAVIELRTQLFAYPDEWIGVLAPTRADVGAIYATLASSDIGDRVQLQRYEDGYDTLDTGRPIIVATMHSAKGLEFRATHLFALDSLTRLDNHQRVAYTAATRAKTSLALYHDQAVPGYIERGLIAVSGAPIETPKIADLFGEPRR